MRRAGGLEHWKLARLPFSPRPPLLHLHPAHSPSGSGFGKLHPRSLAPRLPPPPPPRPGAGAFIGTFIAIIK